MKSIIKVMLAVMFICTATFGDSAIDIVKEANFKCDWSIRQLSRTGTVMQRLLVSRSSYAEAGGPLKT